MALTECWECGEEVSSSAEECPRCGAANPGGTEYGTALQGLIAALPVLLVIAVVIALCGACSEPTSTELPDYRLEKVRGDEQRHLVHEDPATPPDTLDEPLTVRLTRNGTPVEGARVVWVVEVDQSPDGEIALQFCGDLTGIGDVPGDYAPFTELTDKQGRSTVRWINDESDGQQWRCRAHARVEGLDGVQPSATFRATWNPAE